MGKHIKGVIFVLAMLLVGIAISAVLFYVSDDPTDYAYGTITYSFAGAPKRQTPDGQTFDPADILTEEMYEEIKKEMPALANYTYAYMKGSVICVMGKAENSVNAVINRENWDLIRDRNKNEGFDGKNFTTTVYFGNMGPGGKKLNQTDAMKACETILSVHAKGFAKKNGSQFVMDTSYSQLLQLRDLDQWMEDLHSSLNDLNAYIARLEQQAEEHGVDISSEAETVKNNIESYRNSELIPMENHIIDQGIVKEREVARARYNTEIKTLKRKLELQKREKARNEQKEDYNPQADDKAISETEASLDKLNRRIIGLDSEEITAEEIEKAELELQELRDKTFSFEEEQASLISNAYNMAIMPPESIQVSEISWIGTGPFDNMFLRFAAPITAGFTLVGIVAAIILTKAKKNKQRG